MSGPPLFLRWIVNTGWIVIAQSGGNFLCVFSASYLGAIGY